MSATSAFHAGDGEIPALSGRGNLPAWEVPNMLAKYYTTAEAYRLSHRLR